MRHGWQNHESIKGLNHVEPDFDRPEWPECQPGGIVGYQ
nr:hypothetical protein [Pseudomonas sp. P1B16]